MLGIGGGPLVSLAVATNLLAALTGSASSGLTIALDALGATSMARAADIGLGLLHRVAVIGSGTLDTLPHSGAVVTLLAPWLDASRELSRYRLRRHSWADRLTRRHYRARPFLSVLLRSGGGQHGISQC